MSTILKLLFCVTLFSLTTACYRMPGPDEYSLVPSTNNPCFTKESAGPTPGAGF